MKKVNKINIALGKWSFLISLIALGVSIYFGIRSNDLVKRQIALEEEAMKSKIVAQIEIDYNQENIEFYRIDLDDAEAYYRQKYSLILNNIGQVNGSVTEFDLNLKTKNPITNKPAYGGFTGMGPWFYNDQGFELKLPFSIEPNKPRKIILEVGVKVPIKAWSKVKDSIQYGETYNYSEIRELFLEKGHPFIGQLDKMGETGYGDKGNLQKYFLFITKGDGRRIKTKFVHNVSPYIQGETN